MMKNRNLRVHIVKMTRPIRFLVGMFGVVLLAGCTQTIPYKASIRLNIPAEEKRTDELTIRMSKELRNLVVTVKPINIPGAISYRFNMGKSLEANLTSALSDLFRMVQVSTLRLSELGTQANVLEVNLVDYDLRIAPSIFGTHSAKLVIRYSVYRTGMSRLFTLETNSEGTSDMSSAEIRKRVTNSSQVLSSSGYVNSIGRASDEALAKSIDVLVSKMFEALAIGDELEEGRTAISSGNFSKAITILKPLAKNDNPKAQNALGTLYQNGWGVKQDYSNALKWYRKSANNNDPKGQYNLGRMYDNGWGVTKSYKEAVSWYRKSAEQGCSQGQSIVGAMYATGDGVEQDYTQAMKWYKKAAKQGDPEAQRRVGYMYVEGQGVPKDNINAVKWFKEAAKQNHPGGQYWLGRLYFEGKGINKDEKYGLSLLRQSAEQGSKDAMEFLQKQER